MRKDRNAFFSENSMGFSNYNPMMANTMPSVQASSNYYAGPAFNNNQNYGYSDIESRIAKLERQIARLENRVSKLENSNIKSTDDYEETTNNMYMI